MDAPRTRRFLVPPRAPFNHVVRLWEDSLAEPQPPNSPPPKHLIMQNLCNCINNFATWRSWKVGQVLFRQRNQKLEQAPWGIVQTFNPFFETLRVLKHHDINFLESEIGRFTKTRPLDWAGVGTGSTISIFYAEDILKLEGPTWSRMFFLPKTSFFQLEQCNHPSFTIFVHQLLDYMVRMVPKYVLSLNNPKKLRWQ